MFIVGIDIAKRFHEAYYNKVCNYANLRKRSKPIWKAKERSD